MEKSTEFFLSLLSDNEKDKIKKWLSTKKIEIDEITIDEMINSMSSLKQLLNEEISYCSMLSDIDFNINLSSALISAKETKIDKLIDIYNNSNTYNKTKFNEKNEINFEKITTLKKVSLEIDDFDYETPVKISIIFTTHDGEIITKDIIPYNYNGLYKELIKTSEFTTTKFKVANKDNIYFYTCEVGKDYFVMGKEIKLTLKKDYDFDLDGRLVFVGSRLSNQHIVMMYQPNENAYEIDINKKITGVALNFENDITGFVKNKEKRLVIR